MWKGFMMEKLSPLLSHLLSPLFTQEVQQLPVISPSIPFIISLVLRVLMVPQYTVFSYIMWKGFMMEI
jgi:hypothetical protein